MLVFFLCFSRAQTMHLEHQSLIASQSFCLNTKQFSEDSRRLQHAELLNLSDAFLTVFYHPLQCFIIIIIIIIMRELLSDYVQQHRRTELNTIFQNRDTCPVTRSTFKTVSELVAYIPRERYSDINKGIAHANKMILPGCLTVIDVI